MTRYERKLFFECLIALRDAYRAEPKEATATTIEDAMAFASASLGLVAVEVTRDSFLIEVDADGTPDGGCFPSQ